MCTHTIIYSLSLHVIQKFSLISNCAYELPYNPGLYSVDTLFLYKFSCELPYHHAVCSQNWENCYRGNALLLIYVQKTNQWTLLLVVSSLHSGHSLQSYKQWYRWWHSDTDGDTVTQMVTQWHRWWHSDTDGDKNNDHDTNDGMKLSLIVAQMLT